MVKNRIISEIPPATDRAFGRVREAQGEPCTISPLPELAGDPRNIAERIVTDEYPDWHEVRKRIGREATLFHFEDGGINLSLGSHRCLFGMAKACLDSFGLHVPLEGYASPAAATLSPDGELKFTATGGPGSCDASGVICFQGSYPIHEMEAGAYEAVDVDPPGLADAGARLDELARRAAKGLLVTAEERFPAIHDKARWIVGSDDDLMAAARLWLAEVGIDQRQFILFKPCKIIGGTRVAWDITTGQRLRNNEPPWLKALLDKLVITGFDAELPLGKAAAIAGHWEQVEPEVAIEAEPTTAHERVELRAFLAERHPEIFE